MIEPRFWVSIAWAAARLRWMTLSKLTVSKVWMSSMLCNVNRPSRLRAALFTRASTRFHLSRTRMTQSRRASRLAALISCQSNACGRSERHCWMKGVSSRLNVATFQSRLSKRRTIAAPRPRFPPLTSATCGAFMRPSSLWAGWFCRARCAVRRP